MPSLHICSTMLATMGEDIDAIGEMLEPVLYGILYDSVESYADGSSECCENKRCLLCSLYAERP